MKRLGMAILRSMRKRFRGKASRVSDERGGALVEVALLMPMYVLILVGAAELGRLAYYSIEVSNAAYTGASYAAQNHGTASDTTNIVLAASTDAANLTGLTTSSATSCSCTSGTSITCATASNCVSPGRIVEFVQVNTSASVSPIFNYPGVSTTWTVQAQTAMRVEQ